MQERKNFARIKTLTYIYMDACERSYDDHLAAKEKMDEIGDDDSNTDLFEFERRHLISGIQTIVFAAMCMESAIYEYAADHLGDDYVREHLDKLDTLSKWVVCLKLIGGYELRKDRASFSSLKGLISARNRLVHSKSEPLDFENIEAQLDRVQREEEKHNLAVKDAYRTLVLMSAELDIALGPLKHPLPTFDLKRSLLRTTPERLKPVVSECQSVIGRSFKE